MKKITIYICLIIFSVAANAQLLNVRPLENVNTANGTQTASTIINTPNLPQKNQNSTQEAKYIKPLFKRESNDKAFSTDVLLNQNWESGAAGWMVSGYATNTWILNDCAGSNGGGSYAAYVSRGGTVNNCGGSGNKQYAYQSIYSLPLNQYTILYYSIDATCYTNLDITFDYKIVGENGYDEFACVYSTNGGASWTPYTSYASNVGTAWVGTPTLNLPTACERTTFLLGFLFTYDGSTVNQPPAAIDNIYLTGTHDIDPQFTYTCTNCLLSPGNSYNFNSSTSAANTGSSFTGYSWTFGAGSSPATSSSANPSGITYSTPGMKNVCLTITNNFGCSKQVCQVLDLTTLPVELIGFEGFKENGNNTLKWTTASEINNEGFYVEKSGDGSNYSQIGFVTGNGNSNSVNEYLFIDTETNQNTSYYRLKQVDFNGAYEYSDVIAIEGNKLDITISPNPTNGDLFLTTKSDLSKIDNLKVYNIVGEIVLDNNSNFYTVSNNGIKISATKLKEGVYFLNAVIGNKAVNLKFIKK